MLRLCAYSEPITDKKLARTLLKDGLSGLTLGWRQDLGELEEPPTFMVVAQAYEAPYVELTKVPPGVYELFWEVGEDMEQLVFTDKAIFWGTSVFPLGSGITRVRPQDLKQLQTYFTGSGVRLIAFGSAEDPNTRKYQPYRASELIPLALHQGLGLLGQVDLETGEIWPLPDTLVKR